MWPRTFDQRLEAWVDLRRQTQALPVAACLEQINTWWFRAPWCPYRLHWDDTDTWPDPWQLLQDTVFCPLARALGMLYTVTMLERPEFATVELVEIQNHNLVLIQHKKYILNWDPGQIVNILLVDECVSRRLTSEQLQHRTH